jgi:hypothetical protein
VRGDLRVSRSVVLLRGVGYSACLACMVGLDREYCIGGIVGPVDSLHLITLPASTLLLPLLT